MTSAFSSSGFNAQEYFQYRPRYPQKLFDVIYAYHQTTSNSFNRAIDVACGCGNATYPLTSKFESVVGIEPSEGMLRTANSLKDQDYHKIFDMGEKKEKADIRFIQGVAEDIKLEDDSVDLLISTVGANWFDWNGESSDGENVVWKEFGRVLKPGGSVCLVGYWNWIARDYPDLSSAVYLSLPSSVDSNDSQSNFAMKVVHSFYDAIPDPSPEKFDSEKTMRLKFDLEKTQECSGTIKDYQSRKANEIPDYIEQILNSDNKSDHQIQIPIPSNDNDNDVASNVTSTSSSNSKSGPIPTPLKKKMKLSEFVPSFRTQSKFVRYYNSHPEEKEKIKDREDLVWRAAKRIQLKQALVDSKKDGLDLKEGDEELRKYLWDWEEECEVIYPMVILFAKKKNQMRKE